MGLNSSHYLSSDTILMKSSPYISERTSESRTASREAMTLSVALNRIVHAVAKHWLLLTNTVIALLVILPALPPLLAVTAHPSAARVIYALFSPLCHQLPERSFFIFGPQLTYTLEELGLHLGSDVPLRYVGDSALGYKIAICQRDIAMFTAMLMAGMAFGLLRNQTRPLSIKAFLLLCLPMAVDGFGQLFALWESTPWSRVPTAALFGVACVWLAYPYIESGMKDVLRVTEQELGL